MARENKVVPTFPPVFCSLSLGCASSAPPPLLSSLLSLRLLFSVLLLCRVWESTGIFWIFISFGKVGLPLLFPPVRGGEYCAKMDERRGERAHAARCTYTHVHTAAGARSVSPPARRATNERAASADTGRVRVFEESLARLGLGEENVGGPFFFSPVNVVKPKEKGVYFSSTSCLSKNSFVSSSFSCFKLDFFSCLQREKRVFSFSVWWFVCVYFQPYHNWTKSRARRAEGETRLSAT